MVLEANYSWKMVLSIAAKAIDCVRFHGEYMVYYKERCCKWVSVCDFRCSKNRDERTKYKRDEYTRAFILCRIKYDLLLVKTARYAN